MIDSVSDLQLIYCTREVSHSKTNGHKQIKMRSHKNYRIDPFHLLLSNATFPSYEHFPDVNVAYSDFINKLMSIINQIAPFNPFRPARFLLTACAMKFFGVWHSVTFPKIYLGTFWRKINYFIPITSYDVSFDTPV